MSAWPLNVYRVCLSLTTLIAIVAQLMTSADSPVFEVTNFFSYFTIWSNIFAVLVLFAAAARGPSRVLDVLRGAATLSMVTVGILYSSLLTGVESDLLPWVNVVVHYLMPVAVLLDWWVDPPRDKPAARAVLVWLILPLVYVTYTSIRGALVHWYPYPFLDVTARGASVVAVNVAGLVIFTSLLAILIAMDRPRTLGGSPRQR